MNFMGDMGRVTGYFERLREEGAETGIDFEFDGETGDTLDAHRLAEWALKEHGVGAQDKLVTAQFKRYMEIGEAPSDKASQLKCVEMAGLPADARAALADAHQYALPLYAAVSLGGDGPDPLAALTPLVDGTLADMVDAALAVRPRAPAPTAVPAAGPPLPPEASTATHPRYPGALSYPHVPEPDGTRADVWLETSSAQASSPSV